MGNLFLSPQGQIDSSTFLKSGVFLSALSCLMFWILVVQQSLGLTGLIVFLVILYPWYCIWAKRLRSSNKNPAMMIAYVFLFIILSFIFHVVAFLFLSGADFTEAMMASARKEITQDEYMAQFREISANMNPSTVLRNLLLSFFLGSVLTVVIGDRASSTKSNQT